MSSPLSVKRRKLNETTSKLSKPFVSPLRKKQASLQENTSNGNIAHQPYTPSTLAHTVTSAQAKLQPPAEDATSTNLNVTPVTFTRARKPASHGWSSRKKDPAELAEQRAITALELQLRKVQNDVDALNQAQHLASSSTDTDLEELAAKWRLASQAVAEELFGSVKERVCRMGGVTAWRGLEKRKHDRANRLGEFAQQDEPEDDDRDCEFDSEGEELPEDEQEYRKKIKRQAQREMLEAADIDEETREDQDENKSTKVWQEDGKDDDTFTMDMMLRSINVDLAVIGYDKQSHRWT